MRRSDDPIPSYVSRIELKGRRCMHATGRAVAMREVEMRLSEPAATARNGAPLPARVALLPHEQSGQIWYQESQRKRDWQRASCAAYRSAVRVTFVAVFCTPGLSFHVPRR